MANCAAREKKKKTRKEKGSTQKEKKKKKKKKKRRRSNWRLDDTLEAKVLRGGRLYCFWTMDLIPVSGGARKGRAISGSGHGS